MSSKISTQAAIDVTPESKRDSFILVAAIGLLLAGIAAFYYFSKDVEAYFRVPALLFVIAISGFLVWKTSTGRGIISQLIGARAELRKVAWPTRKETTQTTLIIGVFALIMAILLFLMDSSIAWILSKIMGM